MERKRFHVPVKSLQSRTTPIRSITHAASTLLERMVPTVLCYLIPTSSTIYSPGGQTLAPPIATLGGVPIFTPVPVFTPVPLLKNNSEDICQLDKFNSFIKDQYLQ
ncbi:hypothetical protein AVEN_178916-1 [Araneus ventricosus]|uniref:Uncharacterized protein n=1 Tax=Araneus ventricosus TaxID=182803 RepID=A0A4Y2LQM4_ARAVE|nr:hypothetical protein AVEN_156107-1 [Araneus ventricosus]GBN16829.1 hypothetical protein AVEN_178916-1 [Araneus ventricosus]